jgi:outer membrane protein assembly factor BamD (BamD/ComL family)
MSNSIDSRYINTNPATFWQIPSFIVNGTTEKVNVTANKCIPSKRNALNIEEGAAYNLRSRKIFLSPQQHTNSINNPIDPVTEDRSSRKESVEDRPVTNPWQQDIVIQEAYMHFQNKEYDLVIKICASLLNEDLTQNSKKEIQELKERARQEQILDNEQKIKTSDDIQLFVNWCQSYLKKDPYDKPTQRALDRAENCMELLFMAGQAYYPEGNHEEAIKRANTVLQTYKFCQPAEDIRNRAQSTMDAAKERQKNSESLPPPKNNQVQKDNPQTGQGKIDPGRGPHMRAQQEEHKLKSCCLYQEVQNQYENGNFTEALNSCHLLLNNELLKQNLTPVQLQVVACIKKKAQRWLVMKQWIKKTGDIKLVIDWCQLFLKDYPNDEPAKREQERAEKCMKLLDLAEKALDGNHEVAINHAKQVLNDYSLCQKANEILAQAQKVPKNWRPKKLTQAQEECQMHFERLQKVYHFIS